MQIIEKVSLTSLDVTEHQIEKLKAIFPEVFTEGNKIDFEKLKLTLGQDIDTGKERYGMNWPGKSDCFKTIQQTSLATLVPDREGSINFDTTENLFIEGDNLEVLKLLQKSYLGKVKMIYIDPPYNTGNEFIYPDNYSESLDTYLEYTGQKDSEGRRFSTNTETDGRFHSKWMNMMYPRLFLAKNLLREDGVIFISIDDKEVHNLRSLCNEILGEENFVANFIWEKRTNRENRKLVSVRHDYIICYCKESIYKAEAVKILPMSDEALSRYKNIDNDPRGPWKSDPATAQSGHATKSQFYTLVAPNGKEHKLQSGRCWLYTEDVMREAIKDNRIWFGKDGNGVPRVKTYLDIKERGLTPESIWFAHDASTNESAKKDLKEIFDGYAVFETPKPTELIKMALRLGVKDGIVLDFFAGSAATAHATLELNVEDGCNRKFICVQLPEPTDENSEAYKTGYKTISAISKERIRRVSAKLQKEIVDKKAKEAETLFKENGPTIDLGFKVFNLQSSNFRIWDATIAKTPEAIQAQLYRHIDHISPKAEQEAILFELLLKSGFTLSTSIQKLMIEGKTVYSVADGALLVCLEKELTNELIKAIANLQPQRVICLDEGFGNNDQLKTNAVQIMKSKKVLKFQTV